MIYSPLLYSTYSWLYFYFMFMDKWKWWPNVPRYPHYNTFYYYLKWIYQFSSVHFYCSVVSYSLQPHGLHHNRFPVLHQLPEHDQPMSIESVMPSNNLVLCFFLLLLPSILPSIRVFSNESVLCIRCQSIAVSASTSVLLMNIQDWFPLGWTGLLSLQSKRLSEVFSNTTVQTHQFFSAQLSL